jgi:hypothetical protein
MKRIKIKFNNGEIYYLDADIIAKKRADYYAIEVDGFKKDSPEWQEEYEYSLDDNELLDWIGNNVDWCDIENLVYKMGDDIPYDYSEHFYNTEMEIIE